MRLIRDGATIVGLSVPDHPRALALYPVAAEVDGNGQIVKRRYASQFFASQGEAFCRRMGERSGAARRRASAFRTRRILQMRRRGLSLRHIARECERRGLGAITHRGVHYVVQRARLGLNAMRAEYEDRYGYSRQRMPYIFRRFGRSKVFSEPCSDRSYQEEGLLRDGWTADETAALARMRPGEAMDLYGLSATEAIHEIERAENRVREPDVDW